MSSRLERVFWRAVWCSVGWNCHGLLDCLADRIGDTPPARPTPPTRRHR